MIESTSGSLIRPEIIHHVTVLQPDGAENIAISEADAALVQRLHVGRMAREHAAHVPTANSGITVGIVADRIYSTIQHEPNRDVHQTFDEAAAYYQIAANQRPRLQRLVAESAGHAARDAALKHEIAGARAYREAKASAGLGVAGLGLGGGGIPLLQRALRGSHPGYVDVGPVEQPLANPSGVGWIMGGMAVEVSAGSSLVASLRLLINAYDSFAEARASAARALTRNRVAEAMREPAEAV